MLFSKRVLQAFLVFARDIHRWSRGSISDAGDCDCDCGCDLLEKIADGDGRLSGCEKMAFCISYDESFILYKDLRLWVSGILGLIIRCNMI